MPTNTQQLTPAGQSPVLALPPALPPGSPAFERWWNDEGSGMAPRAGEDQEMHARRVAEIAWLNGWYLASLPGEKDKLLLDSGTILLSSMGERIHYVAQDLRRAIEAGMREANSKQ